MIVASLILHVALAVAALRVQANKKARRATAVAVVNKQAEKKKEEEKPKPKPKPAAPPPEKLAMAKPDPGKAQPSKMAPTEAPTEAPVESGLTLGNADGPGIDIGVPARKGQETTKQQQGDEPKKNKEPNKRDKVSQEQRAAEEDTCTEAPSKPVPVTRSTEIEYTQDARANGVEGRLVLKIYIAADGSVEKVEVVSGVDPSLDAAAIAAVKTWTFKPAMRCGKPMGGVAFTLARRFELGD